MALVGDDNVILDTNSPEYEKAKQKYYPFQPDPNKPDDDGNPKGKEYKKTVLTINEGDPLLQQDLNIIIHYFEKDCQNWSEEDYAQAYIYRDVYSTANFSNRVREQFNYYPGMHQTNGQPSEDPLITHARQGAQSNINFWNNAMDNPNSFMSGLQTRQGDFDYGKIFGSESTGEERAKEIGKYLTTCLPCFGALQDLNFMLPDGDLLEIHGLNFSIRTDILEKLMALFKDPGYMFDICNLLKMLSGMCLKDLLAMLAVLTQYLARLNLEINFNLDFVLQLIGPILSPFLDAIAQWLDKWIQLLIDPLICVLDHINETILTIQNFKAPFSSIGANIGLDTGIAAPFHQNASGKFNLGGEAGYGNPDYYLFEKGSGPFAGGWGGAELERFSTPDAEKYNPEVPEYPVEETMMAGEQIGEAFEKGNRVINSNDKEKREEDRQKRWKELREEEKAKRAQVPAPLRPTNNDGTRWSKDDIPNSEKNSVERNFDGRWNPPEKQTRTRPASEYAISSPLIPAMLNFRNILQGAIQYMKDWFNYLTQMIHDLLGFDIGWMSKKGDTTALKSNIIQLIFIIKAIIEAISKNGLKCGTDSNYDPKQMKWILENALNPKLPDGNKFQVEPNGDVKYTYPDIPKTIDNAGKEREKRPDKEKDGKPVVPNDKIKQEFSTTIVKDCFRNVSKEDLSKVQDWISDFEKRGALNNG